MLIALRMKGETAEEMIGAARALARRRAAVRAARLSLRRLLRHRRRRLGADQRLDRGRLRRRGLRACRSPSTATAASARAAARPTCSKRSARRSTSRREAARALLDETGFCFLFAPAYHPGHEACRRWCAAQLEVRTIMNLLGPCINPARPPVQLLGVADPKMLRRIAQTLAAMGVERALVVHGSGLDEVALHGETRAIRLSDGEIEELEITPEDAGLERAPLKRRDRRRRRGECRAAEGAARRARRRRRRATSSSSTPARLLLTAGKAATLARRRGRWRAMLCARAARRRCSTPSSRRAVAEPAAFSARSPRASARELAARFDGVSLDALRAARADARAACARRSARPGARFILEIKKASPSAGAIRPAPIRRRWRAAMPASPTRSAC